MRVLPRQIPCVLLEENVCAVITALLPSWAGQLFLTSSSISALCSGMGTNEDEKDMPGGQGAFELLVFCSISGRRCDKWNKLEADVFGAVERTSVLAPKKENEEGGTDQVLELMFPSVLDSHRRPWG